MAISYLSESTEFYIPSKDETLQRIYHTLILVSCVGAIPGSYFGITFGVAIHNVLWHETSVSTILFPITLLYLVTTTIGVIIGAGITSTLTIMFVGCGDLIKVKVMETGLIPRLTRIGIRVGVWLIILLIVSFLIS